MLLNLVIVVSDFEYPLAAMGNLDGAEIRGSLVTVDEANLSCDAPRIW